MIMQLIKSQSIKNQRGFTFVELLVAMALFSFVMLALSISILQLFNIYQSTIGVRNTQQAARLAAEELTRASRGAGRVVLGTPVAGYGQTSTASGMVATNHDVICFYTSDEVSVADGVDEADNGTMFYTFSSAQNQQNLYKRTIGAADPCVRPAAEEGEQIGSDVDVSFLRFQATLVGDDVVTFRLTIAATSANQAVDLIRSPSDASNVTCSQAQAPQWCSITDLNTSIVLREIRR